jgi:hypothetical protein
LKTTEPLKTIAFALSSVFLLSHVSLAPTAQGSVCVAPVPLQPPPSTANRCCTWRRLPVWVFLPQDRCAEQGPVASHEQSSDQPSRSHSAIESWFCVMANRSSHFGLGSPNSKRKNSAFLSTTFTKPLNSGKRESLPVQMQVTLQCHQVQADVLNRVCQHAAS